MLLDINDFAAGFLLNDVFDEVGLNFLLSAHILSKAAGAKVIKAVLVVIDLTSSFFDHLVEMLVKADELVSRILCSGSRISTAISLDELSRDTSWEQVDDATFKVHDALSELQDVSHALLNLNFGLFRLHINNWLCVSCS